MSERFDITVTMNVTKSQAIALKAMFEYWNQLASMGSSRTVGFYVDGDGNFKPNCRISGAPEVSKEEKERAVISDDHGDRVYDFDPVAWHLPNDEQ